MELRQLRTFVAVVECGGFRRAAARLHFSQPAVTQQIQELERSLGVRLFDRLPGHVELTAAGARFMEAAQRVIAHSDEAVAAARRDPIGGGLRIGIYPGGAAELTHPLFVELRRSLPSSTVEVVPLELRQWADAIDGIDALIMRDPIDPEKVRATRLLSEPLLVAVPWNWSVREAPSLSVEEFLGLPLVRMAPVVPAVLRDWWCLSERRGSLTADVRGYGAESAADVAEDIACGFGAALGTASIARSFGDPRVCFVPLEPVSRTRTWLTTRIEDRRPLVDLLHHTVETITRRLGPLVVPST